MKNKVIMMVAIFAIVVIAAVCFRPWQKRANVKAETAMALSRVAVALEAGDKEALLEGIAVPTSMRGKNADEQYRFRSEEHTSELQSRENF